MFLEGVLINNPLRCKTGPPTAVVARGPGARQVVSQLVEGSTSFVSARLMACLLLVDFWNPVYSAHRLQLMDFVPVSGDRHGLIRF